MYAIIMLDVQSIDQKLQSLGPTAVTLPPYTGPPIAPHAHCVNLELI